MKSIVTGVLALFLAIGASGQKYGATPQDSITCIENLSLYSEFFKQKNYTEGLPYWQKAIDVCPAARKSLYTNGVKAYRHFLKNETDEAKKKELADKLFWIYEQRIANFGQEGYVKGRWASDAMRYRKEDTDYALALFQKSMELQKNKTEAGVLTGYYQTLYRKFAKSKADEDKAILLEEYIPLNDLVAECIKQAETTKDTVKRKKKIANYNKVKNNLDEMFVKIGKCEDIVPIFTKKFDAAPEDLDLAKKTMRVLNKRSCDDNELFPRVAKFVHEKEPSAASAYSIGVMELKAGKNKEALTYFKQAIELCGDCADAGQYNLGAAQASVKAGSKQSAVSFAKKAAADQAQKGKAYLIIAQAIGGSKCGTNQLELKAVYWLAYDYAARAKSADPSVAATASKLMSAYKKQWPSKEMLFQFGALDKPKMTIGCWINESTEVRQGS